MINRKDAEAALAALSIARTPDTVLPNEIATAFKAVAFGAHPDHGGSPEAFKAVTDARAALDGWVKQRVTAELGGLTADNCVQCNGTGIVSQRRGFSAPLRRTCPGCRGTGDSTYDHDLNAGRD